jgi:sialidase-1
LKSTSVLRLLSFLVLFALESLGRSEISTSQAVPVSGIKKIEDIVIYKDDRFYSAFPSIVRRPDGELIVAFRRAPERRNWGATGYSHTDPNSYLVLVRSRDEGKTWSQTPELIYANPFGGSQDPCLLQLRDNSILCASYGWALFTTTPPDQMKKIYRHQNYVSLGGFMLRSTTGGHSWEEPILPPAARGETILDPFGKTVPACNRGAMCEGRDGRIFWAVICSTAIRDKTETHLMISMDKGTSWKDTCVIATDPKITFNETSLYETPKGDLLAFTRTENFNDHTVLARSTNGGKSFEPWQDGGFQGHPHYALRLPDSRVLLVYGYRHSPFGVRARLLNAECSDLSTAPETVLRDDGGGGDLGYPWAAMLSNNRALVVYYFQQNDGIRHIAGTIVELPTTQKTSSP